MPPPPSELPAAAAAPRLRSAPWNCPFEGGLFCLALLSLLPGLLVGPVLDDWVHAYQSHAPLGWWRRLFGLYEFFHVGEVKLALHGGVLPWWSDEELSIAFFRPLSSLLLAVDHLLLDGGGHWSHLHALLWYVLVVLAARRVLVLLFGATEARWGTLLFALSSVHVTPLAFVACRHAHVSAVFALLSFECLLRARRQGQWRWQIGSVLWFMVALAGGESALALLPIAFAVLVAEAGWRCACARLAPHAVASLAFLCLYFTLGYGTHHSGAYLQPGSLEFFRALLPRWLVLTGGLLTGAPPDLWMLGAQSQLVLLGVLTLPLAALVLRSVAGGGRPGLDRLAARRLAALCGGALLALLPLSAGIPGGRLLVLPSVVSAALFAVAARCAAQAWGAGQKWIGLLLGTWVALFGIGAHAVFRALVPLDLARIGGELTAAADSVARRCPAASVLALGVPDGNMAYLPVLFLQRADGVRPPGFHILSMSAGRHRLRQLAGDRFELTIESGFLALPWARIYRGSPVPPGLTRGLQGVDVEVLEARADFVRLALHVRDRAPACWLTLEQGRLVPLEPALGRTLDWTPSLRPQ